MCARPAQLRHCPLASAAPDDRCRLQSAHQPKRAPRGHQRPTVRFAPSASSEPVMSWLGWLQPASRPVNGPQQAHSSYPPVWCIEAARRPRDDGWQVLHVHNRMATAVGGCGAHPHIHGAACVAPVHEQRRNRRGIGHIMRAAAAAAVLHLRHHSAHRHGRSLPMQHNQSCMEACRRMTHRGRHTAPPCRAVVRGPAAASAACVGKAPDEPGTMATGDADAVAALSNAPMLVLAGGDGLRAAESCERHEWWQHAGKGQQERVRAVIKRQPQHPAAQEGAQAAGGRPSAAGTGRCEEAAAVGWPGAVQQQRDQR